MKQGKSAASTLQIKRKTAINHAIAAVAAAAAAAAARRRMSTRKPLEQETRGLFHQEEGDIIVELHGLDPRDAREGYTYIDIAMYGSWGGWNQNQTKDKRK